MQWGAHLLTAAPAAVLVLTWKSLMYTPFRNVFGRDTQLRGYSNVKSSSNSLEGTRVTAAGVQQQQTVRLEAAGTENRCARSVCDDRPWHPVDVDTGGSATVKGLQQMGHDRMLAQGPGNPAGYFSSCPA